MFVHPEFSKYVYEFGDSGEIPVPYDSALEFLEWERVCSFKIENNEIIIEEECDNVFRVNLDKKMMEQFIQELTELTNQLK